ncbi:MAG TPA: hypothetical protein VHB97_01365 [Polyangia bacterium]|jgi:hypothetical protein|nr:hypothetical protein [Polyangia bacterium]
MNKLQLLTVGALLVAGCGGGSGPGSSAGGVPSKLWVATNGDEAHLKLSTVEPDPY